MSVKYFLIILFFTICTININAQFDDYESPFLNLLRQSEINNRLSVDHKYYSVSGKDLQFILMIGRMNGFDNASAVIENKTGTRSLKLKPEFMQITLSVGVGSPKWELNYGDKVTIYFDKNSYYSYVLGKDDGITENQWVRFADQYKAQANSNKYNSYGNSRPNNYSGYNGNSNNSGGGRIVREKCSFCNGTGVSPIATSVAAYGSTQKHWCNVCREYVPATHGAHLKCPSCGGKGYIEKYKP